LKKTDAIPVVFVALAAVVIGSGFMSHRGGPKKYSPEYARQEEARKAKVLPALEALRQGDKSREAEVRGVIASLPPYDSCRTSFAKLLAARGDVREAFDLERVRLHFYERSLLPRNELKFYADLAAKVGRHDEAEWAKRRLASGGSPQT
jgi:hypothetical protein